MNTSVKVPEKSIVEMVVSSISDDILAGRLVAGQRLPESDLISKLKVSRSVLREAFSQLAADGVVDMQKYKGVTVHKLTPDDAAQLIRICSVLEGLSAADAAKNISRDGAKTKLKNAFQHFKIKRIVGILELWDSIRELQEVILDVSKNGYLEKTLRRVHNPLLRQYISQNIEFTDELLADHRSRVSMVISAILKGDSRVAEEAMRLWVSPE